MFRQEMPRVYELWDLIPDPTHPDAYFQNFEENCRDSPQHVKQFYLSLEREFAELDRADWEYLKEEAAPHLIRKDRERHWEPLFNILSQAPAYNYLARCGCADLHFIPRSKRKTPDISALLEGKKVLCEVKCMNISDDESRARQEMTVRSIRTHLDQGFLKKLQSQITTAKSQMAEYDPLGEAREIVYLNIRFDDSLAEYKHLYFQQIDQYLVATALSKIELVFRNDRTPFYRPLTMTAATVDNRRN